MKYTDLTQEQKENITPYLRELFEHLLILQKNKLEYEENAFYYLEQKAYNNIGSYQQAQKEEIKYLENKKIEISDEDTFGLDIAPLSDFTYERLDKLKFESELK